MTKIENGINTPKEVQEYFESIKGNHAALRQFFTAMPKGGDVHNHLTGSAYAETYFELAAKKGMYVDLKTGKLYKEKPEDVETIQLSKDMDDLHNHRMALIDKWSIRNFQPYKYPLGPDEYFFGTFGLLSALTSDIDDLAYLMHELKVRAVRENVQYLEVMATSPSVPTDCFLDEDYDTYDEQLKEHVKNGTYDDARKLLEKIIGEFDAKATEAVSDYVDFVHALDERSNTLKNHLGVDTENLVCRYQGYSSRGSEPLKVFAQLYVVHKACKQDGGKLLAGCNIVAAENGEKSMLYYRLHMEMFAALATKFPDVPTSLHAGELTLGLGRPEHLTYHIGQAVNTAKAHRIGHGVDLPFEQDSDELLKVMQDKKIPVEINLTSNEFILGVKDSEHPISLYHKAKVPLMLCTDDPGILRTSLTEQYTLAALRYGFSYHEIKQFALNSIEYAFLTEENRDSLPNKLNDLLAEFEKKFYIEPTPEEN
ncbi:hypothetical protein KFX89_24705 [Bacteroides thetaiotaomicron]|nr:hypothetical protein [Bacteroides thetaiotaomicron]